MFIIKWIFKKPAYLLGIIGVALLIASMAVTAANDDFIDRAIAGYATISDMSETRMMSDEPKVMVKYEVEGESYERPLNYYEPTMAVGDNVTILYDPEMPERIQSTDADTDKQEKSIAMWGGGVLLAAVLLALSKMARKRKKEQEKKNYSVKKK